MNFVVELEPKEKEKQKAIGKNGLVYLDSVTALVNLDHLVDQLLVQ